MWYYGYLVLPVLYFSILLHTSSINAPSDESRGGGEQTVAAVEPGGEQTVAAVEPGGR